MHVVKVNKVSKISNDFKDAYHKFTQRKQRLKNRPPTAASAKPTVAGISAEVRRRLEEAERAHETNALLSRSSGVATDSIIANFDDEQPNFTQGKTTKCIIHS